MVKNPPAKQEKQVRSLGWEDPLEKETATHSSILVWEIPWTEEPGGLYSPWGRKESDTIEQVNSSNNGPEDEFFVAIFSKIFKNKA